MTDKILYTGSFYQGTITITDIEKYSVICMRIYSMMTHIFLHKIKDRSGYYHNFTGNASYGEWNITLYLMHKSKDTYQVYFYNFYNKGQIDSTAAKDFPITHVFGVVPDMKEL